MSHARLCCFFIPQNEVLTQYLQTFSNRRAKKSTSLWVGKYVALNDNSNAVRYFKPTGKIKSRLDNGMCQVSVKVSCRLVSWTYSRRIPAAIYLLKVNNENTRTRCEIFSKLTIIVNSIFIVNFESISRLVLVFLLLTLNL